MDLSTLLIFAFLLITFLGKNSLRAGPKAIVMWKLKLKDYSFTSGQDLMYARKSLRLPEILLSARCLCEVMLKIWGVLTLLISDSVILLITGKRRISALNLPAVEVRTFRNIGGKWSAHVCSCKTCLAVKL